MDPAQHANKVAYAHIFQGMYITLPGLRFLLPQVHAWFLKISFVRDIGMRIYVSTPKLLIRN